MTKLPVAALIGRTNVGKSSLFNKVIEEQKSLVSNVAGTTRDRYEAQCIWRGRVLRVVDTGGLDIDERDEIERNIVKQAHMAIEKADLIFFVVDLMVGPTQDDFIIAKRLQSSGKPVIVVGNKADNPTVRATVESEAWSNWPLNRPLPISAKQGSGVGDMLDAAYDALALAGVPPVDVSSALPMRVAVFGEPNVGKSTLLNALIGEERFITANVAHTTRQPNDAMLETPDGNYLFIDTAGVRKQANINRGGDKLEKEGVRRTLETLTEADVALFVIDVSRGITGQERHLAGVLAASGVSTVLIANKWDLVPNKKPTSVNEFERKIRQYIPHLRYAPILFTSALTGKRATKDVLKLVRTVFSTRFTQLSQEETRSFINRAIVRTKPTKGKGVKHPNIIRFVQEAVNPPSFVINVNLPRKESLADSYVRFLENLLRETYDFTGTPIRLRVEAGRKKHTTY